ncbi:MAG: PHP domain-containing protein, partial [Negativibacillus sp.]|nr:PHP domain-containing protein [Negativibacillus sp.]
RNTKEDQKELLELCAQNNLIVTGGTDFHGSYASRTANPLGTCVTDQENLKKLFERSKQLEV